MAPTLPVRRLTMTFSHILHTIGADYYEQEILLYPPAAAFNAFTWGYPSPDLSIRSPGTPGPSVGSSIIRRPQACGSWGFLHSRRWRRAQDNRSNQSYCRCCVDLYLYLLIRDPNLKVYQIPDRCRSQACADATVYKIKALKVHQTNPRNRIGDRD